MPSTPSFSVSSYSAPAPSFDMSSLTGGSSMSFGGGGFGSTMSLMGGGSRSTNWKPPTTNNDESAVSGLLAEVEKLTGRSVKKHNHHDDSSNAQMPAFARDFDDDDSSNSQPDTQRERARDMSWGQVVSSNMGGSSMSALQQQAPMQAAPAAPVAPPQAAPASNNYLADLT